MKAKFYQFSETLLLSENRTGNNYYMFAIYRDGVSFNIVSLSDSKEKNKVLYYNMWEHHNVAKVLFTLLYKCEKNGSISVYLDEYLFDN